MGQNHPCFKHHFIPENQKCNCRWLPYELAQSIYLTIELVITPKRMSHSFWRLFLFYASFCKSLIHYSFYMPALTQNHRSQKSKGVFQLDTNHINAMKIRHYTEQFLLDHFGEKADRIQVTYTPPFLIIHLKGFLLPSEKIFLERGQTEKVLETRDILIQSVKPTLLEEIQQFTEIPLVDLYADWNLHRQTGLLIIKMETGQASYPLPETVNEEALHEIVLMNSMRSQRKPDEINFYWLSHQVLLVERIGILVDIEEQLLKNGLQEELRLAKLPLERRILSLFNLEAHLNRQIEDLFVDWDFSQDRSYMVFILAAQ